MPAASNEMGKYFSEAKILGGQTAYQQNEGRTSEKHFSLGQGTAAGPV